MLHLRHLLIVALLQLVAIPAVACHSDSYEPDFYKIMLRSDLVCLAVCERTGQDFEYEGMIASTGFFRVLDPMTIHTQEEGDTILVTGQDGLNCGEMLSRFNSGDTVFLALGTGFYYEFESDTFYLEGARGKYFLEVNEGMNNGLDIQQINDKIYYLKQLEDEGAWQMFHPYRELLYADESSYRGVLGLRVDSVALDESVHYIFNHNIQMEGGEWCNTPFGPSWMGRKVSIGPDGENTFFNKIGDTIRVLSLARTGESWLCYKGDDFYVEAMVVDQDTMGFLGVVDSVKTIGFEVFDLDSARVDHPLDQMSMLISKTHGAIQVLNFKLFPDIMEYGYGYYRDQVGMYELKGMTDPALGLQNFGWKEIFGFAVGDEFHILDNSHTINDRENYESARERKTILKVLDAEYSETEFSYHFERKELLFTLNDGKGKYEFTYDTLYRTYGPNPELDLMPGESYMNEENWAKSSFMSGGDLPTKTVLQAALDGSPGDPCWSEISYFGCLMDENYLIGLGGPYGSCWGGVDSSTKAEKELVYYSKSWGTWGTPFVLTGQDEPAKPDQLRVYPNPARNYLMIESAETITEIQIVDLSGRILLRQKSQEHNMHIDLDGFQEGVYMLGIEVDGSYHWEKVILQ